MGNQDWIALLATIVEKETEKAVNVELKRDA